MKNFLVCVLKRNDRFEKTLPNFCRVKEWPLWKPIFHLKRNELVLKTLVVYFIFEYKWPCHKYFSYLKAYWIGYLFICCRSHCTFDSTIWHLCGITWYLNRVFACWNTHAYIYIYIFILFSRDNDFVMQYSFVLYLQR